MAPTVFSPVLATDRFNPFTDSLTRLLRRVAGEGPSRDDQLVEFLADLYAQSWPGTVGDALWEPASLSPENLKNVTTAFDAVIALYGARKCKAVRSEAGSD
jgi:hypothetical protein